MRLTRKRTGSIVGSAILLFACLFLGWMFISFEDDFAWYRQDNAWFLSQVFALTLMQNRVETAKEFTDTDQWERLDRWAEEHEAVECIQFGIPDEGSVQSSGPYYEVRNGHRIATIPLLITSVSCIGFEYSITIKDIQLRETSDGWIIEEWGEVRE